jgi:acetylserotonin N-methyltransferase
VSSVSATGPTSPPLSHATAVDAQPIWDLIDAFRRSKILFAAVDAGIFDGARPASEGGRRLLDACVALGLLEKRGDEYVNAAISDAYLTCGAAQSLRGYAVFSNHVLYKLWDELEAIVTETDEAARAAIRRRARHVFLRHKQEFVDGMHSSGVFSSLRLAESVDLSMFRTVVDVGGGSGHFARALKARYPDLDVAVLDLPDVVEAARAHHGTSLRVVAGDFMRDDLPTADCFALLRVLHNLSAAQIAHLLSRAYAATRPGGGILLGEIFLDGATGLSVQAHLQDVNMLVATAGRERTSLEYRRLLQDAGYCDAVVIRLGARVDGLLARKPPTVL